MISYELFEATIIHDLVCTGDNRDDDRGMYRDNDGSNIIILKEYVTISFEQHKLFPGYTVCRSSLGGEGRVGTCSYANNEEFIRKFCSKYNIPLALDDDELAAIKKYKRDAGFGHLRETLYYAKWRLKVSNSTLEKIFEQSKNDVQSALCQSAARFQKIVESNETFMQKIKGWSVRSHTYDDIYQASISVGEKGVATFNVYNALLDHPSYNYDVSFSFKDIGLRDLKSEEEKIGVALAIYSTITAHSTGTEFDPPYIQVRQSSHNGILCDERIIIGVNGKKSRTLSEW